MKLGSKLGKSVKIDTAKSLASRGRFARMCVEVDLTKPLISKFNLRRRTRRIEYEGIHLICFGCGKYGHRKDACPLETHNNGVEQELPNGDSAGEDTRSLARNQERKDEPICNPKIMEDYGSWMLDLRRSRKPQPKQANANIMEIRYDKGKGKIHQSNAKRDSNQNGRSSNFEVLADEVEGNLPMGESAGLEVLNEK